MPSDTLIVHLSDLHIRPPGQRVEGRIDTAAALQRTVQAVLRLRPLPDAVVITGDLTDTGCAEAYAHLAELLRPLPMPVYLLPGNHDDRTQLRQSLPWHRYLGQQGPVCYSVTVGPWRLLALDSSVPGHEHGELDAVQLDWLEAELNTHDHQLTLLALHHPPFATHIAGMDAIGLRCGVTELEHLLRHRPQVERLLCGHVHRTVEARFAGTIASTVAAPAHQIALDLQPGAPLAWTLEPPTLRVLVCPPHGPVVSHLWPVQPPDGPHPFA